ncbi:hypothetical protein L3Y34_001705 [Caenorhabditis briggsae]|uniref:NADH dehydrogenase [ubiquinone] 1 subunit C2 n=1 Tax=Caenorhabditis briggsae TaxID=6238 RepID=A0AAE9DDP9_CAEBR|nr:hypothetical protein L3Y34_001705 [Caenorhabditis briggsae]
MNDKFYVGQNRKMAETTRVSEKELERREGFIRAGHRERHVIDPFTWSYPWKGAGVMLGVSTAALYLQNRWNKKPYYYAIVPRLLLIGAASAMGYAAGALREKHYQTRDAVIEHYMQLHPEDFDHFNDRNGRSFSQVLLPWYPRRTQYTRYD